MDSNFLLLFIATMGTATFLTRVAPFFLPHSVAEKSSVRIANQILPPAILTLLVIYSLKDTTYRSPPHGFPELLALSAVAAVHLWRRNALMSIFVGTGLFMFLKQIVFANRTSLQTDARDVAVDAAQLNGDLRRE